MPVWCGGMLETGVGRAANVALAALPGFLLPGDTSASSRYFAEDVTEPYVLGSGEHRGQLRVPDAPGTGVTVRDELVRDWASSAPVVIGRWCQNRRRGVLRTRSRTLSRRPAQ